MTTLLTAIHATTIVGKCPLGCADLYRAIFTVSGPAVTPVEAIDAAIAELTEVPTYQEDLTRRLSERLGCEVVTRGTHGRFATTCRAVPA